MYVCTPVVPDTAYLPQGGNGNTEIEERWVRVRLKGVVDETAAARLEREPVVLCCVTLC